MTEREQFEEQFAKPHDLPLRRVISDRRYESMATEYAWLAWQDGRASQQVTEGFVMVPDAANMTDEQAEAIAKVANCCGGIAYEIYCAAIAASPTAEAAERTEP